MDGAGCCSEYKATYSCGLQLQGAAAVTAVTTANDGTCYCYAGLVAGLLAECSCCSCCWCCKDPMIAGTIACRGAANRNRNTRTMSTHT
jgi:hypothetical protein